MLAYLTAFLWRVGLLGIVLAETSCVVAKVRGGVATKMLQCTCALAFGTTVLLTICYAGSFCGHIVTPHNTAQVESILTPALCVLAVVGFLTATLTCFARRKSAVPKSAPVAKTPAPSYRQNATWEEIKEAWTQAYTQNSKTESRRQKALRQWAGTLALCAGVCLLATCVEVMWSNPGDFRAAPRVERQGSPSHGHVRPASG